MKKTINQKIKNVAVSARNAKAHISKMTPKKKANLEKGWDIEHAYYSSSLEGSKIDRREFEKIAKKIK